MALDQIEIVERGPSDFVVTIGGNPQAYYPTRVQAEAFRDGVEHCREAETDR